MTKIELTKKANIPVQKLSLVVNQRINNIINKDKENITQEFPIFSDSSSNISEDIKYPVMIYLLLTFFDGTYKSKN